MTKKQIQTDHEDKNKSRLEVFLDNETIAIIDAQCEEHKTNRAKFIAVVVRLFLDFSYIARTVGKDTFSFRDEMIKAIVRSKGANVAAADIIDKINEGDKGQPKKSAGHNAPDLSVLKEKFAGIISEMTELKSAFIELKDSVIKANILTGIENGGASRHATEKKKERAHAALDESGIKENKHEKITIDELASEFKNSAPPSYKDKRKKLNKLKF